MKLLLASTVTLFLWVVLAQVREPRARAGDNGPATKAEINDPQAIALDHSKTLYVVQEGGIRRVDLKSGIVTTVHTKTPLNSISSLAVDSVGNLIAIESAADRVCRINPTTGSVTVIAGGKGLGFSGDGGPAIDAKLSSPYFVTTDGADNIYITDTGNSRIRRVDAKTGIIATIVGSGKSDSSGDGGPALQAGLEFPMSVALDREGNLFISQFGYGQGSHRIRRVEAKTGIITTIAGLAKAGMAGDGGSTSSAGLQSPSGLLFDRRGNLYVVDPVNDRVRVIDDNTKTIRTIAGTTEGFGGDGGLATLARLNNPCSIAMDSVGNLYIADYRNHGIRRVDAHTGIIRTVAGNGLPNHGHMML